MLQAGILKNRNLLSHSSGNWKSKIKVPEGLVPSESNEEDSVPHFSSSFWGFPGNLQHSLACRSFTLISAQIFTCCSSCVCLCVCERERGRERECVCVCTHVCVCVSKFPFFIEKKYWTRGPTYSSMTPYSLGISATTLFLNTVTF